MLGLELETGLPGMWKQVEQPVDAVCVFKVKGKRVNNIEEYVLNPLSKQTDKKYFFLFSFQ